MDAGSVAADETDHRKMRVIFNCFLKVTKKKKRKGAHFLLFHLYFKHLMCSTSEHTVNITEKQNLTHKLLAFCARQACTNV